MYAGWNATPYYAFILALSRIWRNRKLEIDVPLPMKLGSYAEAFAAWHDPAGFSTFVSWLCDEHVFEARAVNGNHLRFPGMTLAYFPVEVCALARVRESMGLAMPIVTHSFLQTPLRDIPRTLTTIRHPLLEEILEFLLLNISGLSECGLPKLTSPDA